MLRGAAAVLCAGLGVSCAAGRMTPPAAAAAPVADLPDGRGKQVLVTSCTSCHDLREVTKFRGYYNRAQWRDIVVTMVDYGADVETDDIELLADYLTAHLGRRATAATP